MDDIQLDSVFSGRLDNLPPLPSRIVRIFTSSTFTDMSVERNALMEEVYPRIKEFCKERYGLEFQVVDMRWGVRDEATDDHMTTELCLKEIKNCQRLSVGPNFVAFLGQKYGYRPIPTFIPSTEFLNILNALREINAQGRDLLTRWYLEDRNALPHLYTLQPVSSILTNFNNKKEPHLQAEAQDRWWATLKSLQALLRIGSEYLFKKNEMKREEMHNYYMSVTEREIITGIINVEKVKKHCLAFVRQIADIDFTDSKTVAQFVDLVENGEIDGEAQTLLAELRDEKLLRRLSSKNLHKYEVSWSKGSGVNSTEHSTYLATFKEEFYNGITRLVRQAMRKQLKTSMQDMAMEPLRHLHSCVENFSLFLGREKELRITEDYFRSVHPWPMILVGASGSGKTSLMAKIASSISTWLDAPNPLLILRFIGTTPESSSVVPLLRSLCYQLSYFYGFPLEDIPTDLIPLSIRYKELLQNGAKHQPSVIILDAIDQLSGPKDISMKLGWLSSELPQHVKVLLSCSTLESKELDFLRKVLPEHQNSAASIEDIDHNLALDIVKKMLHAKQRTITTMQLTSVVDALNNCTSPIFVKLVAAEISSWKSFTTDTWLSHSVMGSIEKLFKSIEVQHGAILVSHCFAYITASKNGLSETELEDLISLDDTVLNDIYQYHLPPIRRIPPLLWTRIRNDLSTYLTERDVGGVSVLNWYHRQFMEVAVARYLYTEQVTQDFHSALADYFSGKWGGGRPKLYKYTESQRTRFALETEEGLADRKVPLQPNVYLSNEGELLGYNLRKLDELPYHLCRCNRFDDLLAEVLFNYNWLLAKLSCCPMQAALSDFEDAKETLMRSTNTDVYLLKEIDFITDGLKLGATYLAEHPTMLSCQLLSRLLPLANTCPNIGSFLRQCDEDGPNHSALLPVSHCLHTPGGPLLHSLEGHSIAVFDFDYTSDQRHILSVSNKFIMWDLSTGEVTRDIDPEAKGIMGALLITKNDKHALTYTSYNHVYAVDILKSEVMSFGLQEVDADEEIKGIAVDITETTGAVWTKTQITIFDLLPTLKQKKTLKVSECLDQTCKLISLDYVSQDEFHLVMETDDESFTLQSVFSELQWTPLSFFYGITLSNSKEIAYIGNENGQVCMYSRTKSNWNFCSCLSKDNDKSDRLLSLAFDSQKEAFLVAIRLRGFQLFHLSQSSLIYLRLPDSVKNISVEPLASSTKISFTEGCEYFVAGVRKCLYVWSTRTGEALKVLDAHYARITQLKSVTMDRKSVLVSASFDKTVKVWNVEHLFEKYFNVPRMEMSITSIAFASEAFLAATITRNAVGIWCLRDGSLKTILVDSAVGAIVSNATIAQNAKYVCVSESQKLLVWDLKENNVIYRCEHPNVKFMALAAKDTQLIVISGSGMSPEVSFFIKSVPDLKTISNTSHKLSERPSRLPIITKNEKYVVIPALNDKNQEVILSFDMERKDFHKTLSFEDFNYLCIIALKYKENESVISLMYSDAGHIYDVETGTNLAKIPRWNGHCTSDGQFGLFSTPRGGLELLELRHGATVKVLLGQTSDGVHTSISGFVTGNKYVYYYHGGRRVVYLIRLHDGNLIATYKVHVEPTVVQSSPDGTTLVVGGADGSLVLLYIVDPENPMNKDALMQLPSRANIYKSLKDSNQETKCDL